VVGMLERRRILVYASPIGVVDTEGVFVARIGSVAFLLMLFAYGIELVCLTSMGLTRSFVLFAVVRVGVKTCGLFVKLCGCTVRSSGLFSVIYNMCIASPCFEFIIPGRVIWSIWNLQRVLGHRMRDSHFTVFPATMVRIDKQAVRNIIYRAIMERTMRLQDA